MRFERSAICTSGEPVSASWIRYWLMRSDFCCLVVDKIQSRYSVGLFLNTRISCKRDTITAGGWENDPSRHSNPEEVANASGRRGCDHPRDGFAEERVRRADGRAAGSRNPKARREPRTNRIPCTLVGADPRRQRTRIDERDVEPHEARLAPPANVRREQSRGRRGVSQELRDARLAEGTAGVHADYADGGD